MGGAILKAVLMLCSVALVFVACSEEPNRRKTDPAPRRTLVEGTVSGNTVEQGIVASGYVEDEGVLSVEEARLQRGQRAEEDQIVVRASVRGSAGEQGCFLMQGPDWFALKRTIDSGATLPESPQQGEILWADQSPTDEFYGGNTYVAIFRGDQGREEASPRKTSFFAFCYKDADPGGASGPTARYDVAHVEGTPDTPQ